MATANEILDQLRNLLAQANGATGNGDINLTGAVGTLIDGYGQGGGNIDALIDGSITEISSEVTEVRDSAFKSCASLTSVSLPNAKTLEKNAFAGCTSLQSISLPAATDIPPSCFSACDALVSVDIPLATSADMQSFYKCISLKSIRLPRVSSTGMQSFQGCTALTTVDLPKAYSIGSQSFYGCTALETLILRYAYNVCSFGTNSLYNTLIASGAGHIYVPSALVDSYKSATGWSTYADQIRAIEDYPDITGG